MKFVDIQLCLNNICCLVSTIHDVKLTEHVNEHTDLEKNCQKRFLWLVTQHQQILKINTIEGFENPFIDNLYS